MPGPRETHPGPTAAQGLCPVAASAQHSRAWYRYAAIGLGLSVFVVAECICALLDVGHPSSHDDPFVGFDEVHPLFVKDDSAGEYRIPKSRQKFFVPDSFPSEKKSNSFRIFCFGGSTVQGRPYSIKTSFTAWLEMGLGAADDRKDWEVVNCGGISYASYRLVPILTECLDYDPDLFILCTGHNEFLEARTYAHIKHAPPLVSVPQKFLSRRRTYVLLREWLLDISGQSSRTKPDRRPKLTTEVDAFLDYQNGIKVYQRDEPWRRGVMEHYAHNVRRMVSIARGAGVPIFLMRPSSNLCDSPPFKSQHRDGLTENELNECNRLIEAARSSYRSDLLRSVELLRSAIDIDDQFAGIWYELGKCYETLRQYESARAAFWQARELDICPLRILEPMEQALLEIAQDERVPLIDMHELLESGSKHQMLGGPILVDHIHPSFKGHQLIADALIEEMARQDWLQPKPDWKAAAAATYQAHIDSLGDFYFLQGQRRLEALRGWAQGRADGPPVESRFPDRFPKQN